MSEKSKHIYQYDYLRILAAVMVIMLHTIEADKAAALLGEGLLLSLANMASTLLLTCNVLYLMISGALLLPFKDEGILEFYKKRIGSVFIPMFVFYVWYLLPIFFDRPLNTLYDIQYVLITFFTGNTAMSPHYWLINAILALYVAVPFLRYMLKDMPYKMLSGLCLLALIFMGISAFGPEKFFISTWISGWSGVAIIGYWVTRPESRRFYKHLIIAGLLAAFLCVVLVLTTQNYTKYCVNLSPISNIIVIGLFAFVFTFKGFFSKGNKVLGFLSKYSYPVILIHWWVLYNVTIGKLNLHTTSFGKLGFIVSPIVTFIVSLILGFVLNTIIELVSKLFTNKLKV